MNESDCVCIYWLLLLLGWVWCLRADLQMKARPNRNLVKISVSDYERMRNEIYEEALVDGVKQGVALCLIALEKNSGWKKKRLERVFDGVGDLLQLPDIFGVEFTTEDAIQHLQKEFEIDIDRLEMKVKI